MSEDKHAQEWIRVGVIFNFKFTIIVRRTVKNYQNDSN